jgi:hypothetical protein
VYQRALAGKEKVLGREHASTLDTMHNLAKVYALQGKTAAAEDVQHKRRRRYDAIAPTP